MFIFLSLLISLNLKAQHLEMVCKNALAPLGNGFYQKNDPIFHEEYLARRVLVPENGLRYVVETHQGQRLYQIPERIYDLALVDQHLIVLFASHFSVLDLQGREVARFNLNPLPYRSSHGRSIVHVNNVLYIARGAAGVSAFSMDEMRMIWDADLRGIEKGGSAEAIVFDGTHLQLIASTTQQFGFTGVITMSLQGEIVSTTPYDTRRSGVIGTGARARWHNNSLIINNLGWIHILSKSQLSQTRAIRPRWLAHQIRERNNQFHYMMLTGDMILEGNKLKGCGLTYAEPHRERVARLFEISL